MISTTYLQLQVQFSTARHERPVHPFHETIENLAKIIRDWTEIFLLAPETERVKWATEPLFSKDLEVFLARESTRPIHFIMILADYPALQMIVPYLDPLDWQRGVPLMELLILGLAKGCKKFRGADPVACANKILEHCPKGDYAKLIQTARQTLQNKYDDIEKHGKGEMGKSIVRKDGSREYADDYWLALNCLRDLELLLTGGRARL